MSFKSLFTFFFVLLIASAFAACDRRERKRSLRSMHQRFEIEIFRTPGLGAALLRAGFHDCITANPGDPESGCNGSLNYEAADPNNARLALAIATVKQAVVDFPCVSHADAYLVAYSAASVSIGSGNLLTDLVDFDGEGRKDVDKGDFVTDGAGNQVLTLPNPASPKWTDQSNFYKNKGLTDEDLVISLVVGHSVGSFTFPPVTGPLFNFTETSPDRVNGDYCGALALQHDLKAGNNLPGFNFLPSDLALIAPAADGSFPGYNILRDRCNTQIRPRENYILTFGETRSDLKEKFKEFSKKMAGLTGQHLLNIGKNDIFPPAS